MATSAPMSSSHACLQTVTYRDKGIIMLPLLYILQLNFMVLLVYIYVLLLISYMYCMFQVKIKKLFYSIILILFYYSFSYMLCPVIY